MDLQVGSTIGDYQIVDVLGAGGMGKVYKVRNFISDRIEAMKVLLPDLGNAPELADRFMREIKLQASLEHPNIARLHTALRIDNQLLMLMEYVEGVTLDHKLKDGPLPVANAVDYMRQVLSALEYAHARSVIHRDIKPANMMLTPEGVVKLMDFGIAKAATDHRLTMTGTTLGSLYYMSPEQIQGTVAVDARSDLYSAGVTLYELVTAKRPFDGTSQFEIMSAHLNKMPVAPIEVDPRLPQILNDVILMAVAKSPDARFQTAAAFRNALGSVAPANAMPAAAGAAPAAGAMPKSATAMGAGAAPPIAAAPKAPAAVPPMAAAASPILAGALKDSGPHKSRRGLWMGIGAVAMAGVIIALIQFAPWRGTKAAPAIPESKPVVAAPAPEPQPAPAPTPAEATPTAAAQTAPAAAAQTAPPVATPASAGRPPASTKAKQVTAQVAPAPATAPPQAAPTQVAAPPAQVAAPPAPAPGPPPVNRAQLQEAREQLVMLNARVEGIHGSLASLQRSQAASGLNLRGDMQTAANLMDSFMQGANSALNAGDVAAAKGFLGKAEIQVEKLEKFLNR